MNLLLDTHCVLWWLADDDQLSQPVRSAIADPSNTIFISAAALWEIRIKQALGKLRVPDSLRDAIDTQGFVELPVHLDHVDRLVDLPPLHRDPFDRLLVAQAMQTGFVLATQDDEIRRYDVVVLPAS